MELCFPTDPNPETLHPKPSTLNQPLTWQTPNPSPQPQTLKAHTLDLRVGRSTCRRTSTFRLTSTSSRSAWRRCSGIKASAASSRRAPSSLPSSYPPAPLPLNPAPLSRTLRPPILGLPRPPQPLTFCDRVLISPFRRSAPVPLQKVRTYPPSEGPHLAASLHAPQPPRPPSVPSTLHARPRC